MRLDAMPDIGERQVIVYSHWDRSSDLVESQVTYPIVTALLGAPHVKAVRGVSDFGYSFVYVIFDDNTDLYWARARTLEYLSGVLTRLPESVKTEIGPDATSLGWIYQYALVDTSGTHNLSDLRSLQDWYLRYYLKAIPGVADVAPVGGFSKQYQINVDPSRLQAYGISINQVVDAVRQGNNETTARVMEFGGSEYMVRGRGYAASLSDFQNLVVATSKDGVPILIKDLGEAVIGPEIRRGVADLNGRGEVVSGIVIMRTGENALQVIDAVKAKIKELEPSLPPGVKIVPVYDRSQLIHRIIRSGKETIFEVVITVALIIAIFLWHFPSALIPIITMPAAILIAFIPLRLLGVSVNVMSLAGIAIAFGELIDASIVIVEQTHKRLEQWEAAGCVGSRRGIILGAIREVAGPTFFSLLVIAVSFLPVLALEAEEGRMFTPLVYSKSIALLVAAALAVTLDPALRLLLSRAEPLAFQPRWLCSIANVLLVGKIQRERSHPVSRFLIGIYEPIVSWTLRNKGVVLAAALLLIASTIPVYFALGSEFIPPMDEGTLLYMPTSMPGISIAQAQRVLQVTDAILKQFPEVDTVLGKAGGAESPTDPAPLSMLETIITLRPRSEWRHIDTWYSAWAPEWSKKIFRHITPDTVSTEELISEMDAALKVPGISNAWTMPIRGRIDMLTSGIRTPVGLKISGADPKTIEEIGSQVQAILSQVRGTRGVFAERTDGGYYIDVDWRREQLARYGLSIEQAQQVLNSAIGGDNITTVFQGQERYPVNVRYMRDFRMNIDNLNHVLVPIDRQHQIPLSEIAAIRVHSGPSMIRDENGLLTGYVYITLGDRDPGSYIAEAAPLVRKWLKLTPGYLVSWSGQYEAIERVHRRLWIAIPATLALIILLIYLNTGSAAKTLIVLLAVPFSAVGAIWLLYFLDYNLSVAVWVGLIGLLGIDAETGVFMLLYLELAYKDRRVAGRLKTLDDLRETIIYGAATRLRPKFMTFATTCIGLLPVMWSIGAGSEVMKRIAAPMVGGIFSSVLLELLVYPAVYELWKRHTVSEEQPVVSSLTIEQEEAALN
jgi:Cu(I)/Ag(I) efflux system membrane protein CusA/SilA